MILLSPFAQRLRNGMPNAKTPPPDWWGSVLALLRTDVVQIGVDGEPQLQVVSDFRRNLPFEEIIHLVKECETWLSTDSFLPHLAHHVGRPGVVIFSRSDPRVFGYQENCNLLRSYGYLRKNTFGMWEEESYIADAFPTPELVARAVGRMLQRKAA